MGRTKGETGSGRGVGKDVKNRMDYIIHLIASVPQRSRVWAPYLEDGDGVSSLGGPRIGGKVVPLLPNWLRRTSTEIGPRKGLNRAQDG